MTAIIASIMLVVMGLVHHVQHRTRPLFTALASWYYDAGLPTASGFHATYGVANKYMPFGTRLTICYHGCVLAVVDDRGPYVGGRVFDLDQTTAQAIGFSGVAPVRWSYG